MKSNQNGPIQPWWRYGMVWLVIAGPLIVVMASILSAVLAVRGADPVVTSAADESYQRPAIQGRNHAATSGHSSVKP